MYHIPIFFLSEFELIFNSFNDLMIDASIFVSYAEGVDVKNQNKPDFISRLKLAKTIKTNNNQFQIQNLLAQNRADWLISRKEEYFFE